LRSIRVKCIIYALHGTERMKPSEIFIGAAIIFAICVLIRVLKSIPSTKSGFTDKQVSKAAAADAKAAANDVIVFDEQMNPPPYSLDPINSVDDYEYNLVFRGEGDKAMTKATRDVLMSAYPKDWTTHPPSSELFQQGLAAYKEGFANSPPPQKGNPYKEVDGSNMTPPDSKAAEDAERDILTTYVPKKPGELTTYDLDDAEEIVKRIYTAKGLVAYTKRGDNNTVTVMSTSKIGEEVVYEDEYPISASNAGAPTGTGAVKAAGEGTVDVPVNIVNLGPKDPFFTPVSQEGRTRSDKWDYTSWTPGLERMFAPTEPQTKWY
jgi:hypothetical protein